MNSNVEEMLTELIKNVDKKSTGTTRSIKRCKDAMKATTSVTEYAEKNGAMLAEADRKGDLLFIKQELVLILDSMDKAVQSIKE